MQKENAMSLKIDRNMFTQVDRDSGSLTMLSYIVHSFGEPGEYRGTVHGQGRQAVFYVTVDKESPVAQVDIDLAALMDPAGDEECGGRSKNHFTVNPRGYAVFSVSGGPGGYNFRIRQALDDLDTPVFDSQKLGKGDYFAATILRPGRYSVTNVHTKARTELVVPYLVRGEKKYQPPGPLRVRSNGDYFEQKEMRLMPAQGLVFECEGPSRFKIKLEEPDDGSSERVAA
jgi:hypothetical protein